jgi:DNA polymerase-1
MKTRTLLIDGSYLLKRSFNGAKDLYTNKFGHIGCLYQTITMLRLLISKYQINKCIFFVDGSMSGKERYQLDHAYKANRKNKSWYGGIELSESEIKIEKEKEVSYLLQMKRVQSYLEELFIRQIQIEEVESDDLIASYVLSHNNLEEMYIYSADRDYAQLLNLNIKIIFPNIDKPVDNLNYSLYFKHHYTNALPIKIICGDTSDNIKGIEGIKETTLLKHIPELKFKTHTVNDICKKAKEINEERVANKMKPLKCFENLIKGYDRLRLNYKLMNLKEPMLSEEAIEELKQLEMPLSPDDRGSENLIKMMMEDEFLTIYKGTFIDYVKPFYTVIMNEKQMLNEYYKNRKK